MIRLWATPDSAMSNEATCQQHDLLGTPWKAILFWGLPWAVIFIGGNTGPIAHTVLWTVAFAGVGVACLVNARRCRRRHCFYTGPLLLLAAIFSLLYGLGVLPLGVNGWAWIAGITLLGSILLCCGLDVMFGKYVGAGSADKGGEN